MSIAASNQAQQIQQQIQQTNAVLNQAAQTRVQGQAAIAADNHVVGLQQLEKDVILPADPHGRQAAVQLAQTANSASKPQLPNPFANPFSGADNDQEGLIAIMGTVLALQAKTNSNFWSTLWNQASQSMMTQVKFAPIIGDAMKSQYDAQSQATLLQSKQSSTQGWINIGAFAGGMVMGTMGEVQEGAAVKDESLVAETEKAVVPPEANPPTEEESAPSDEAAPNAAANNPAAQENNLDAASDKTVNNENQSNTDRAKSTLNQVKSKLQTAMGRYSSWLQKATQATSAMSGAAQGGSYLAVAPLQEQQATWEAAQGKAGAISQEGQAYATFYGQDFSREEELRQGSGQNIDYAMNILQQAANSITGTVTSMFRG